MTDFTRRWTQFALEAEYDHFGTARFVKAHNEQMDKLAALQSQLAASEKKHGDIYYKTAHEVEQILGKALGYPWFKDDLKNFPDATEADGVCVGEHVPETIAAAAANRIKKLEAQLAASRERERILREGLEKIKRFYKEIDLGTPAFAYVPTSDFDYKRGEQGGMNEMAIRAIIALDNAKGITIKAAEEVNG